MPTLIRDGIKLYRGWPVNPVFALLEFDLNFTHLISGSTACHALEHGFRTVLVEDASRGVNLEDIDEMRAKLLRGGAVVTNSEDVSQFYHQGSAGLSYW